MALGLAGVFYVSGVPNPPAWMYAGVTAIFLSAFAPALWVARRTRRDPAAYWVRAEVELGVDGFGLFGEFIPWLRVETIELVPPPRDRYAPGDDIPEEDLGALVRVHTKSGAREIRTPTFGGAKRLAREMNEALVADRSRQRVPITDLPQALRQDEDVSPRSAAVPRQVLVRVAEDAAHERSVRVRAARLAVRGGNPAWADELAEATADDVLRKALESD